MGVSLSSIFFLFFFRNTKNIRNGKVYTRYPLDTKWHPCYTIDMERVYFGRAAKAKADSMLRSIGAKLSTDLELPSSHLLVTSQSLNHCDICGIITNKRITRLFRTNTRACGSCANLSRELAKAWRISKHSEPEPIVIIDLAKRYIAKRG